MANEEVKFCCNHLNSDKVTERKRAADKLKHLLDNKNIVSALNNSSKSANSSQVNWDKVFLSSKQFFLKESEKLERDQRNKENPSSNILSNWENVKRTAADLPKVVLKKSCKGIPLIHVDLVIELVCTILSRERSFLLENYVVDALQIIQRYLLLYPQYYLHISQDNWRELIRIIIWTFDHEVQNLDLMSVLCIIEGIIKVFPQSQIRSQEVSSPSIALRPLPSFLCRAVLKAKSTNHYGLQTALLSLLCVTCSEFGIQWRYLLCNIGEETFQDVMSMWENKNTPAQINLLRYFNFQLIMHHPQQDGVYHDDDEYAANVQTWKRKLHQLYLHVYENIMKTATSSRLGSKEMVPDELIFLAARLCSKIFCDYEDVASVNITQVGATQLQTQASHLAHTSKRRRVDIGFSSICEKLREDGIQPSNIPWFRIVCHMLTNYSHFFTHFNRAEMLLDLLLHLLPLCKSILVMEVVFRCLEELADSRFFPVSAENAEVSNGKWTKIAELTTRFVAGKQCSSTGMQLLRTLILNNLTYPQSALFRLFGKGVLTMNKEGLELLEAILVSYPVPKLRMQNHHLTGEEGVDSRETFLRLILPLKNELEDAEASTSCCPIEHPSLVANILTLLRLKNTLKVKMKRISQAEFINTETLNKEMSSEKKLEEHYLKPFSFSNIAVSKNEYSLDFSEALLTNCNEFHVILMDRTNHFIEERVNNLQMDIYTRDVLQAFNICDMIIQMWHLIECEKLKNLFPKLDKICKFIEGKLSPTSDGEQPWNVIVSIFERLNNLLASALSQNRLHKINDGYLQNLLNAFPRSFEKKCFDFVKAREPLSPANCQRQNVSQFPSFNNNVSQLEGPLFDPDLDDVDMDSLRNEISTLPSDDWEVELNDSESERKKWQTLSRSCLAPKDEAVLSVTECLAYFYDLSVIVHPSVPSDDLIFVGCVNVYENLGKSERIEDVIMALEYVKLVFSMTFEDDNVLDGILTLKNLLSNHSTNSRVVLAALESLKELIATNGSRLPPKQRQYIIQVLIANLNEKFKRGLYGQDVCELLYETLVQVVKVDPLRTWSFFTVCEDERLSQIYDQIRNPYHGLRMKVVESVPLLFQTDGSPLPYKHQKEMFAKLFKTAEESLVFEGRLSELFLADEGKCRVFSFLSCMVAAANSSSVSESHALFAIVSSVKVNKIDVNVVKRALGGLKAAAVHHNPTEYIRQHVPSLVSQWVRDDHPLLEFPVHALDCDDFRVFGRRYYHEVATSLFAIDEEMMNQLEIFAQELGVGVKTLMEENFASLMAVILPCLVASSIDCEDRLKLSESEMASGTRKRKYMENALGKELWRSHMDNDIGEVVLSLLRLTHDPNPWYEDEVIVPPSSFCLKNETVLATLKEGHNYHFQEYPSLLTVLCDRKAPIHTLLHGLYTDVMQAMTSMGTRLRQALGSFETFVKVILPALGNHLVDMEHFIVKRILHILMHFIVKLGSQQRHMTEKCCKLLRDFVVGCLNVPSATQALIVMVPFVVPRLHSLHCETAIWSSVYEVLLLFFTSVSEPLRERVASLVHLSIDQSNPDLKHVQTLHESLITKYEGRIGLRKILENFVQTPTSEITHYHLQNILYSLTEKKDEVNELYLVTLPSGPLAAHALIHKLITFVSSTRHPQEELLALECLGKLGPVDLNTCVFLLHCSTSDDSHFPRSNEERRMAIKLLQDLNRLMYCDNLYVMEAAVVTLRRLLSVKFCYEALKDYNDPSLWSDLMPFIPTRKPKSATRQFADMCIAEFEQKISNRSLWEVTSNFNNWLTKLTTALIEAGCGADFFNHLLPICRIESSFCESVLPLIFFHMLKTDNTRRRDVVSRSVTDLIKCLCRDLSDGETISEKSHVLRGSLRLILKVINFLRTKGTDISYSKREKPTAWDRNLWLDLDYLLLAKAAYKCGSLFSAVLFAEIACDMLQEKINVNIDVKSPLSCRMQNRNLPPLQRIAASPEGKEISALLLQVYSDLGSSDGVEGCAEVSSTLNCMVQFTLSHHRGHNIQALCISDAGDDFSCLVKLLRNFGLFNVLHKMTNSSDIKSPLVNDVKAECAWRLGCWEDFDVTECGNGFNPSFCKALTHLKDRDECSFLETKNAFYHSTIAFLKENGNESTSEIYPLLTNLQIFSELSQLFECVKIPTKSESNFLPVMISSWEACENFGPMNKEHKESILSARINSLKVLSLKNEEKSYPKHVLFKLSIEKAGYGELGEKMRSLREAQHFKVVPQHDFVLKLEEAKLSVLLGNNSQAICTLDDIIKKFEHFRDSNSEENRNCYYKALLLYSQILVNSRTHSPKEIIENHYGKAIKLTESKLGKPCGLLENWYHELAVFGDRLYQEIQMALSSDHSQSRQRQMERSLLEINRLRQLAKNSESKLSGLKDDLDERENRRKLGLLERDYNREKNDFESQEKSKEEYLRLALENYLKALVSSSRHDLTIFRVVALWLENLTKENTNALVHRYSIKVKSHKFIPLLYQLVARVTLLKDPSKHHPSFPNILNTILERVCCNHPHHGLPVLLMLANSHLDEDLKKSTKTGRRNSKAKPRSNDDTIFDEEDRVKAAKRLVDKLKQNVGLEGHIAELETVFVAYITLALGDRKNIQSLTATNPLAKLRHLKYSVPLTRLIPVQASATYSCPVISSWKSTVDLVGGINAPLKLTIYSSDGFESRELLKGNDDLRQDAVLEQVFSIVNELLRKDSEASKQNLSINTYMVAPLSQRTGLIQWCDNTTTIGDYLVKAHKKYYPKDYQASQCRNILRDIHQTTLGSQETKRVKAMEEILGNFHPVFRFFFYEEYPSPEMWFYHRRAYTRSVASSSIAGYILGLGDRHVQNILLDRKTAQVIHIDLGIAFENGKLLPTPERVPFRMTQDIVDGFGVMGVEGPLRKNMETTLRVLREAKSVLVTIVEVLRHDPLHHWTVSPSQIAKFKQQERQEIIPEEDSNSVSMAERTLIRVQQKLNGLQDGRVLSVSEHVSVLLQQSTEISNLAQMFPGWQPYL